jgi:ATP-binding cassette, subfamily B, multidrug efflux pump
MFRWFESRIDPFALGGFVMPPSALLSFYWHFVRPVWPVFALILFFDLLAAISEVLLATFVAQLIDLMKSAVTAASFFSDHPGLLVWMAFVILVARPMIIFVYELLKNQVLSPPFQTRVRWQTHGYILRQSLDFFQNEFAGRVANKLMQTAPAIRDSFIMLSDAAVFVAVQWLSAIVLFWAADPRLIIALVAWLVAYGFALAWFVPLIRKRSTESSEARSTLLGRIVDSYTNILTVKLFAHAENEDAYARTALEEQTSKHQSYVRVTTLLYSALAKFFRQHALHRDIDRDRRQTDAAVEHGLASLDAHVAGQLGIAHHLDQGFQRFLAEAARQLAHRICGRHSYVFPRPARATFQPG